MAEVVDQWLFLPDESENVTTVVCMREEDRCAELAELWDLLILADNPFRDPEEAPPLQGSTAVLEPDADLETLQPQASYSRLITDSGSSLQQFVERWLFVPRDEDDLDTLICVSNEDLCVSLGELDSLLEAPVNPFRPER